MLFLVSLASWSQGPITRLMRPVYERKLAFEKLVDPKMRLAAVKLHIGKEGGEEGEGGLERMD